MNDEQRRTIKELIQRYTKEACESPEKARAALIREGIYRAYPVNAQWS